VATQKEGAPPPTPPPAGRGVICEVTPIRLLTYFVKVFSLTERTEFTEPFGAHFEPTERLRHTDITERYCQRRVLGDGCWVLMISKRRMLGDGCWL